VWYKATHPREKCGRIGLPLVGNSPGGEAAPTCLQLSVSDQSNTQVQGCRDVGSRMPRRARGIPAAGEIRAGEPVGGGCVRAEHDLIQLTPCAGEHTVEGKEESRISRFIVPRSRPENLYLVTQTSCLLYMWHLCHKVLGTDEAYCAWHCTYIYFKTVLAAESLELTQNDIFNKSTIIATTKMKTKL